MRGLARVLLVVLISWISFGIPAGSAHADPPAECEEFDEWGQCVIYIPPDPPDYSNPPREDPGDPGDPGDPSCVDPRFDRPVACVIGDWYWSYEWACHTRLTNPQPGWGDPVWPGTRDGAIYDCARGMTLDDPIPDEVTIRWSPIPPWGAPPDPEELAEEAVALMNLRAIEVGITPHDLPGHVGIIGYPQYMWVADEGPSTWGPITRTASAGPFSVTATAQVERIEWDMGNGDVVTCTTPGTPYRDGFGKKPSPDCGYGYTEDGYYDVTATSYWVVEWAGMGQSGTIELDLSQTTQIVMGEVQVITQ